MPELGSSRQAVQARAWCDSSRIIECSRRRTSASGMALESTTPRLPCKCRTVLRFCLLLVYIQVSVSVCLIGDEWVCDGAEWMCDGRQAVQSPAKPLLTTGQSSCCPDSCSSVHLSITPEAEWHLSTTRLAVPLMIRLSEVWCLGRCCQTRYLCEQAVIAHE
jgi:hypothetical protein